MKFRYDGGQLERDAREFLGKETYSVLHRRLVRLTLALPPTVTVALLAVNSVYVEIGWLSVSAVVGASAALSAGIYLTGRYLLQRRTRQIFGVPKGRL